MAGSLTLLGIIQKKKEKKKKKKKRDNWCQPDKEIGS
jgi:hypothetical protein